MVTPRHIGGCHAGCLCRMAFRAISSGLSCGTLPTFQLMTPAMDDDHVQSTTIELLVPFDPRVTPTTVLPSQWDDDGSLRLPAVINAPDFGQMLLSESGGQRLKARLEGSRADKTVDLVVELPPLKSGESCSLNIMPLRLPAPQGLTDRPCGRKHGEVGSVPSSRALGGAIRLDRSARRPASWAIMSSAIRPVVPFPERCTGCWRARHRLDRLERKCHGL